LWHHITIKTTFWPLLSHFWSLCLFVHICEQCEIVGEIDCRVCKSINLSYPRLHDSGIITVVIVVTFDYLGHFKKFIFTYLLTFFQGNGRSSPNYPPGALLCSPLGLPRTPDRPHRQFLYPPFASTRPVPWQFNYCLLDRRPGFVDVFASRHQRRHRSVWTRFRAVAHRHSGRHHRRLLQTLLATQAEVPVGQPRPPGRPTPQGVPGGRRPDPDVPHRLRSRPKRVGERLSVSRSQRRCRRHGVGQFQLPDDEVELPRLWRHDDVTQAGGVRVPSQVHGRGRLLIFRIHLLLQRTCAL